MILVLVVVGLPLLAYQPYLIVDDWYLLWELDGRAGRIGPWVPFDLYHFYDGNPSFTRALQARGAAPWFAAPELRWWFLRPLTSASVALDHWLSGTSALGFKLHSLAWHAALLASVAAFYRRHLTQRTAWLSTLLFATAITQFEPATWVASRHATMGMSVGLLSLMAYVRYREERWAPGLWRSALGWVVGFLCGEIALGSLVFAAAWELTSARDPWSERAKALSPAVVIGAVWLFAYASLGFGAGGSDVYIDPLREPAAAARAALPGLARLSAIHLLEIPSAVLFYAVHLDAVFIAAGTLSAAGFALLARYAWGFLPERDRAALRWWLVACGAWVMLASVSGHRALVCSSIGVCAALAAVAQAWWERIRHERGLAPRAAGAYTALLLFMGLVVSPTLWVTLSNIQRGMSERFERIVRRADLGESPGPEDQVVLVASPHTYFGPIFVHVREVLGVPSPGAFWVLSYAEGRQEVRRLDAHTIEVHALESGPLSSNIVQLFRKLDVPPRVGDEVRIDGFTVRTTAVRGNDIERMVVRFDRALDDPHLRFIQWSKQAGLVPLRLPEDGSPVQLSWDPASVWELPDEVTSVGKPGRTGP